MLSELGSEGFRYGGRALISYRRHPRACSAARLTWLRPIRSNLERDREQHGRQGSEVEHELVFLVPVSEPFKRPPACRKGRCKLRLYPHPELFERFGRLGGLGLNIVTPHRFKSLACWCAQQVNQAK